jgi:hypothetical protein
MGPACVPISPCRATRMALQSDYSSDPPPFVSHNPIEPVPVKFSRERWPSASKCSMTGPMARVALDDTKDPRLWPQTLHAPTMEGSATRAGAALAGGPLETTSPGASFRSHRLMSHLDVGSAGIARLRHPHVALSQALVTSRRQRWNKGCQFPRQQIRSRSRNQLRHELFLSGEMTCKMSSPPSRR